MESYDNDDELRLICVLSGICDMCVAHLMLYIFAIDSRM